MANEDHVEILKQGYKVWNKWRKENKSVIPDLSEAELLGASLVWVDLREANLHRAILSRADLREAKLDEANLTEANLSEANLSRRDLRKTVLKGANLIGANLRKTNLSATDLSHTDLSETKLMESNLSGVTLNGSNLVEADLTKADMQGADLSKAYAPYVNLQRANLAKATFKETNLIGANFSRAYLKDADFQQALCGYSTFTDLDLSVAKNLDLASHSAPSSIGIDTFYLSRGNIPLEFLDGCGVPETMITFARSLVGKAIEYYSCFISHSFKDEEFAHQLNAQMKSKGLRVYYAPEEMKGGRKIHEQLYEAIRYHDKLILVLSESSMKSDWVQLEIKRARKHEREEKRRKLFPISLVPYEEIKKWELITSDGEDLADEIKLYYIPDFSQWKDYDEFNAAFDRLLRDLRADE